MLIYDICFSDISLSFFFTQFFFFKKLILYWDIAN